MSSLPWFPIILDRVKSTFPDREQSSVSLSVSRQSRAARGIFSVHISQNPGQKGQARALTWPECQAIKHRKDTSDLDDADAIVIELGREIFGSKKVTSATFARSLRQFGGRALIDLVALMGNYAGTAALLTAFDMQLDRGQPPPLPPR
jgi:hypothetical protein